MGIRGELFSSRVGCEGRTYFFNVKENRMGDMFLTVVESKPTETEGFERRSVVIFREDIPDFLKAFQGALDFMAQGDGDKASLAYAPAGKQSLKGKSARGGFEGSEGPAAPDAAAPKRKIVVRRKGEPKGESEPKDKA
jgi:hypothetical protein